MSTLTTDLARCPLLANVGDDDLARIAQASRVVNVRTGELVFREGQPCDGFYIVAEGAVRLYKIGPDGRERTLHVVRPPYAFAEAVMFGPGAFPASATAVEDSRLIRVQREPFLRMLREQPETAFRVIESLSGWMHRLLDQLENVTLLNARAKLTNYLLRKTCQESPDGTQYRVELTEPKKDIASHLGMAPETFSRALADLEARNLIRVSGRCIDLIDAAALEALLLGDISDA